MAVVPQFTRGDVQAAFAKSLQAIDAAIVNTLSYLGEACVNKARSVNSYRDQTGNLRNSIGYVIVKNGKVIKSNFQRSASVVVSSPSGRTRQTTGSNDGVKVGEALAKQLAEGVQGYGLIVVAGMNYATSVEAQGKDVLSSAEKFAETELPRMLKDLKVTIANLR